MVFADRLRLGATRILTGALLLALAACGSTGSSVSSSSLPPEVGVATSAPPQAPEDAPAEEGRERLPHEVLATNIRLARTACKGCGAELNLDAATRQKSIVSLMREHAQHKDFVLSEANAERALYGPEGSTPTLAGANKPPPDVSFLDKSGQEVYRREVKTFSGAPTTFARQFEDYAKKLTYRGELFVQVPPGTDVRRLMEAFWAKNRDDRRLARYADVYVAFHTPDGRPLGLWMLGARGMGVPG
ncbi:hypothetical protein [Micromonospora sp. NPDC049900]|uniref:hypothetical protein n=1 Tax=unclassified Micromonospora TaxID=2617518 RepID=UPI0037B6E2A3